MVIDGHWLSLMVIGCYFLLINSGSIFSQIFADFFADFADANSQKYYILRKSALDLR
jgi:hypothetical protein